jgi:uncharacterized protein YraI
MKRTRLQPGAIMSRHLPRLSVLVLLSALAGCSVPVAGVEVVGDLRGEEFLRMRAGPGLGYAVVLGLPEGTEVVRRDCVTELGQPWCRVMLANAPTITGFVAEDYLVAP